ncbi:hypothetical protein [Amycolatopsis saalfeldensis]|uniref:hypothetical protein n=1 Tax=Amycolatopsis saalfeldensis TaxID=394193 RepID=UPI001160AE09|nr:hypothetical protein [Amycolatopsis saalfeldensis]
MTVEQTLKKLQHTARQKSVPDASRHLTWKLPDDLATEDAKFIVLDRADCDLKDQLIAELASDLRFEHMGEPEKAVLRFVADASLRRAANHVSAFIEQYARVVEEHTIVFTTFHLDLPERLEFGGVKLLPLEDELVPDVPELANIPDCGGYLMTSCQGTDYGLMEARARQVARRALGLLRVGMQMEFRYHRRQLRFRLGDTYVIADKQVGSQQRDDIAYTAPLHRDVLDRVLGRAVTRLPVLPQKKGLIKQAQLALDWINRSLVASEPLIAMLYQFFALEAMLGDTAEGLKSHQLAFRRTMLGHLVDGGWPAPESIYGQYDKIRSAAVHGSEAPVISPKAASLFESDVIQTVEQCLTFATANDLTTRAQVRRALAGHQNVQVVLEHLQARDPEWANFVPSTT